MRYLGMDVHVKATVWCLLDESEEVIEQGKSASSAAGLAELVRRLSAAGPLKAAQECGKLSHFVHDVLAPLAPRWHRRATQASAASGWLGCCRRSSK